LRVLVNTFAVLAVIFFHFAVFNSFRAAITAIISTAAIVVFVVTVAIPFVVREFTSPWAVFSAAVATASFGVKALASFAVFSPNRTVLVGFLTTISAVILAATVVVFVVTIAIPFVVREFAKALAVTVAFILGVQTCACLAIFGID